MRYTVFPGSLRSGVPIAQVRIPLWSPSLSWISPWSCTRIHYPCSNPCLGVWLLRNVAPLLALWPSGLPGPHPPQRASFFPRVLLGVWKEGGGTVSGDLSAQSLSRKEQGDIMLSGRAAALVLEGRGGRVPFLCVSEDPQSTSDPGAPGKLCKDQAAEGSLCRPALWNRPAVCLLGWELRGTKPRGDGVRLPLLIL